MRVSASYLFSNLVFQTPVVANLVEVDPALLLSERS